MKTITTKSDNKVITEMKHNENALVRRMNSFSRKQKLSVHKFLKDAIVSYANKNGETYKSFTKTTLKSFLESVGMYDAEKKTVSYIKLNKDGALEFVNKKFDADWSIKLAYIVAFESSLVEKGKVLTIDVVASVMAKAEAEG